MPQSAQAREVVGFSGNYSTGTIVVKTNERALYLVLGNGKALRYPVGVGRASKQWTGTAMINGKQLRAGLVATRGGQARQALAAERDPGRRPQQSHGRGGDDLERWGIRHPRHRSARGSI